jgi:hypothetical protein
VSQCHVCGIPADAGFFDRSAVVGGPNPGEEVVLAAYDLHRNYCGLLLYFSQFAGGPGVTARDVRTEGYRWGIRVDGTPRDPYAGFEHIVNPWGLDGFPIQVRLDPGSRVELVVGNRNPLGTPRRLEVVGGRILGRYWYDTRFGGAPNPL